ncbi:Uncharacterized protein GBIM_01935 [Gryllus bimaculatus]|nr:Uncharacterized protein GBIM_01935 [Gryllus bimaculatus]
MQFPYMNPTLPTLFAAESDSRWDEIDQPTKDSMEFKVEEDGEFWMELNDFTSNFKHITFATKKPVEMDDAKYCEVLHGSWEKGISAGGNQSDMKIFATNPQFSLIVNEADEEDDECSVVLELIQENDRQKCRCLEDIALFIYEESNIKDNGTSTALGIKATLCMYVMVQDRDRSKGYVDLLFVEHK